MQSNAGERYGMGTADMQAYVPPASGTATGVGGGSAGRGLSHLFGHPAQASATADLTGMHTLHLHRPSTTSFQQVAAEQQYLEQLSTHQHTLALRGNAAQQVANPFLHAGLQAHHSMASFFKTVSGGLSGHPEAPDTISHSFFNMAPGQEQFKLSGYGNSQQQQQQQLAGNQEDEASAGWRSDETAALLKVCSDVDLSSKAPMVWDDVARKLQEMGYQRSPQRCKEKFESFHTSYKKGKEENQRRELEFSSDFSSDGGHAGHVLEGGHAANLQTSDNYDNNNDDEEDIIEEDNHNNNENSKKRKMSSFLAPSKSFFEKLTRDIIEKQEELHRAFLETIERKDRERVMREEAYRRQEAARLDREQELRAQEVSIAASRDAALIAFLEKATGQSLANTLPKIAGMSAHAVAPLSSTHGSASAHAATLAAALFQQQQQQNSCDQSLLHHQALQDASDMDNNSDMNTKRWPKVEVHALIRLRSGMEPRFREAGPKAHLWQEISTSMACLGFIRSPKRCKEKWENINKYFKKTKDSSKKRPENAKTCPYFHQLDTLYQRGILTSSSSGSSSKLLGKSDNLLEYNTQDDEDGFNMQNSDTMHGEREGDIAEMQNAEQQARDKEMHNDQMDKFLHQHAAASGALNMNVATKKSLQVEMFVKDILDLQQQQHQKLVEEYDRMEQAHELRELERQQIKTTGTSLSHGNTHDNATLMALVHKLAGDSSDLSMSAPSSME
ncbi:hypothetical protein GOP47_0006100 [Adiantum capillus-veneris]|uniref:Myb-like domain-containing protein n=1 Tax=Adiantum capillus-veneris TaxID=13818 RepID=A0A9D4ZK31_ADICA|nr:hypothetical protein GOP47_0006100 [Adiantum capillus-veneris]